MAKHYFKNQWRQVFKNGGSAWLATNGKPADAAAQATPTLAPALKY
jgi:hypothetical protein